MSIKTLFYADGSTVYSAEDFRKLFSPLLSSGVRYVGSLNGGNPDLTGGEFCVLQNGGMSVKVYPGVAAKKHFKNQMDVSGETYSIISDAAVVVNIPANTSGYNRIDMIAIEIDPVNNTTAIKDVQGTPSSDPQRPSANEYQLALAYVAVGNNVSIINQNVITDARTQMTVPIAPQIESGTFTPSLKGATTAGVFTYYDQSGQYTVIGNICIAQVKVEINQITTPAAGNLVLIGLPKIGVGAQFTDIAGKIAGLSFIGAVNTNHGAIYQLNVTGYVDAAGLKSTDGFTCTLVYRC